MHDRFERTTLAVAIFLIPGSAGVTRFLTCAPRSAAFAV